MERTDEQKTRPVKGAKKDNGWREREEARAAGVTPRSPLQSDEPTPVRC